MSLKAIDTGFLRNLITYDASGNISLPAGLSIFVNKEVATKEYVDAQNSGQVLQSRTLTINGVNFAEDVYIEDFYATSCALDDSGQVGVASFAGGAIPLATTSRIYSTTNGWNNFDIFQPDVPIPLAPPRISGVNVSSDGTYWSAVSSNQGYSYTCTDGDGIFIARGSGNNPTFNNLSK
jgi:hypothetical protein